MLDQSLPEDLKGYPLVQEIETDGRTVKAMVHVLEEARLRAELEPSVVLLDELNRIKERLVPRRPSAYLLY
jgi:hypothetical protein